MSFFNYDFDRPVIEDTDIFSIEWMDLQREYYNSNTVYRRFHCTLIQQLNQRTFLDMILKSKASKNEDRFYAVLPQSEYKSDLLTSKHEVGQWNINTITSVKLKLYEIMNTRDKLNLLFWSGNNKSSNVGLILPTFATSTLALDASTDCLTEHRCNFNLYNPFTIKLRQTTIDSRKKKSQESSFQYYLSLKPLEYYTLGSGIHGFLGPDNTTYYSQEKVNPEKIPLYRCHQIIDLNDAHADLEAQLDIVGIPSFKSKFLSWKFDGTPLDCCIFLIGNPVKNKWILDHRRFLLDPDDSDVWVHQRIEDYTTPLSSYRFLSV
ncbi:hypothetical protein BCR42DRAFT_456050 [Absidia repens]|uniref:Uncharacterized protein n=1 Tax=Absidia repens TaxID=90262 RepID=A0A1X2I1X3_9FUNG|nr:hypothetical protein BCR42DRAFT_456050 [Absidia repens]